MMKVMYGPPYLRSVKKLNFSNYVLLPSINKFLLCRVNLCNIAEVYIFKHGRCILALEQVRMLILRNYIFLASINIIFKNCHILLI